jgi:hypothetical protein
MLVDIIVGTVIVIAWVALALVEGTEKATKDIKEAHKSIKEVWNG